MSGRYLSLEIRRLIALLVLLVVAVGMTFDLPSEARKGGARKSSKKSSSRSAGKSRSGKSRRGGHVVASRRGGRGKHHKGRHHGRHHHHHVAHKPRYAYPVEMFMMKAPDFDASTMPEDQASQVISSFARGTADRYPARTLVRAGVVKYHPLRGGIYWRREPIKYIVMHSTETGIPVSGVRVIESWSSMGRRHPGAQYVVDRDGTIYQAVDPDLATVHINILKTLPGINNDNSIGIEMNHTGRQDYPEAQLQSVIRLVTYLQDRYQVANENIITHRYAQRGDHTDPVHFDWKGFLWAKDRHRNEAIAFKMNSLEKQSATWGDYTTTQAETPPTFLLQPHNVVPTQVIQQQRPPLTVEPVGAPPAMQGPAGAPPAMQPQWAPPVMQPAGDVVPPPAVKPAAPSAGPEQPVKSTAPAHAAPPLRGPIEMGPEHAGDLSAPKAD